MYKVSAVTIQNGKRDAIDLNEKKLKIAVETLGT